MGMHRCIRLCGTVDRHMRNDDGSKTGIENRYIDGEVVVDTLSIHALSFDAPIPQSER
jgi:hypothetical protein